MSTATTLMTAEEYARMEDRGVPTELVRGEVVEMNQPTPRHGQICGNVYYELRRHCERNDSGHVSCNDAGVLTERNPDTVRGGDVWFVSYQKVPRGPLPAKHLEVAPDVVVEVRSEHDRWARVHEKVAEYLNADVPVVCVLDPSTRTDRMYYADAPEVILHEADDMTFPEQLPGFAVRVGKLFESWA